MSRDEHRNRKRDRRDRRDGHDWSRRNRRDRRDSLIGGDTSTATDTSKDPIVSGGTHTYHQESNHHSGDGIYHENLHDDRHGNATTYRDDGGFYGSPGYADNHDGHEDDYYRHTLIAAAPQPF